MIGKNEMESIVRAQVNEVLEKQDVLDKDEKHSELKNKNYLMLRLVKVIIYDLRRTAKDENDLLDLNYVSDLIEMDEVEIEVFKNLSLSQEIVLSKTGEGRDYKLLIEIDSDVIDGLFEGDEVKREKIMHQFRSVFSQTAENHRQIFKERGDNPLSKD